MIYALNSPSKIFRNCLITPLLLFAEPKLQAQTINNTSADLSARSINYRYHKLQWELVPKNEGVKSNNKIIWEKIETVKTYNSEFKAQPKLNELTWEKVSPDEVIVTEFTNDEKPPRTTFQKPNKSAIIQLPPRPKLQALDRSVAFSDNTVGPDISWNIPNGLRWSERWFGNASIVSRGFGFSLDRGPFNFRSGDAVGIVHTNILNAGSWSFGLNASIRSVTQTRERPSPFGEGFSNGFRIATALSDTSGIALGGEQVLQWDDKTTTGRNLYLMATKGWWLGEQRRDYPLLIANGGIGTGRFANEGILVWDNPLRFACIDDVENRRGLAVVDNDLCWSPIGSVSLVFNDFASTILEYRSGQAQAAASIALTDYIPVRFTWGVNFAARNEALEFDKWTWIFRASASF